MKPEIKNVDDAVKRYLPSAPEERIDAGTTRVLNELRSQSRPVVDRTLRPVPAHPSAWRRIVMASAAAAVLLTVFIGTIVWQHRAPGVLETVDGSQKIDYGEVVRANDSAGAQIRLADGSRIEMRSGSELSLERADDGVRIRLNKGDVIVTAAKQHGHLYVQTRDVNVSVVGTVFLVKAELEGSHVAVIEGEVRVQQGTTEKELLPGDQIMTKPLMEWRPVSEEFSWSHNAKSHLVLLQKSAIPSGTARSTESSAVFEVASIRPSAPPAAGVIPVDGPTCHGVAGFEQVDPRRFVATGITLFTLVMSAYGTDCVLVDGGPEWIRSDRFDIQALIPAGAPDYTLQDLMKGNAPGLQGRIQNLLAERFKLAVHREMKEMPHYDLVVAKSGKMKLSEDQSLPYAPVPPPPLRPVGVDYQIPRGTMSLKTTPSGESILSLKALPVSELAKILQSRLATGRIVVDKTGLKGLYDIRLQFGPESSPSATKALQGTPLSTAIQEQLGLKLESTKTPVEVLEIDHAEKPSEN